MKPKRIVILTYYRFPCREAVLENVFARKIGANFNLIWVFQGSKQKRRIDRWYRSKVLLTPGLSRNHLIAKIVDRLLSLDKLVSTLQLIQNKGVDTLIVRDMPVYGLIFGVLKKRFEYELWFQYTAPLGTMNLEYFNIEKSLKRYWYRAQGLIYNRVVQAALSLADIILPITEYHKDELIRENPDLRDKKFHVLSMGFDSRSIQTVKQPVETLDELKKNYHLIAYFGSLNFNRNPKLMVDMAHELKKSVRNFKIYLIGKTAGQRESDELRSYIRQLGVSSEVILTGYIDRKRLYDHLRYFDASLSPIPPTKHYLISSPTKMYESMGLGIPVIANREIYEQNKVISASKGGILVDYDVKQFSQAIVRILSDEEYRRLLADNGRKYILANYAYERMADELVQHTGMGC